MFPNGTAPNLSRKRWRTKQMDCSSIDQAPESGEAASPRKQIGASIDIPPPSGSMKPAAFKLDDAPLIGHGKKFE